MILQCPECKVRYLTPDTSIGPKGRTVRCAKCKHMWFVAGVAKPAELAELSNMLGEINVTPKPIPAGSNLPAKRRKKASGGLKVGVLAAAAMAAAIAVLITRPAVIGSPPSASFVLADVAMVKTAEPGKTPIYEITGKIVNTADHTLTTPILRVTVVDPEGSALQYWDFSEDGKQLASNESVPFTTGAMEVMFSRAHRFVVELGSPMELALRKKP